MQTERTVKRAVLTLALGKPVYIEMAYNLARSFFWWHRDSDIQFILATDSKSVLPKDLRKIEVIRLEAGQYGYGFSPKLQLDRMTPAEETLFLDADCLCVANLEPVFEKFHDREVSVVGRTEVDGELFGDIAARCRAVRVPWVPRFCGGLYYLKKGEVCAEVFRAARQLETRYDELGLARLRGVPNEEPLIGLGMALCGQQPVPDDGSIKAEPMFFSGPVEVDVFAGRARLSDHADKPKPYPEWQLPGEARPAVVHFVAYFANRPPYTTEAFRLRRVLRDGWPLPVATFFAALTQTLPHRISEWIKETLRPLYHAWFGPRALKPSDRE